MNIGNNEDDEENISDITLIKQSPYVNSDEFVSFCLERKNNFNIFSLNIQSIRAKFDEFQIILSEIKLKNFEFSAICFQETWLMDEADLSLLQLPGYTLISQSTICSSHGGLAIYLHDTFNYTLLPIYKRSTIWEGLFIEIEGKQLSNNVVIGNMYRPPRDRNENYPSFINEIDPVLTTLGNFKCEIILTGDLNINLLNVNVKPIF